MWFFFIHSLWHRPHPLIGIYGSIHSFSCLSVTNLLEISVFGFKVRFFSANITILTSCQIKKMLTNLLSHSPKPTSITTNLHHISLVNQLSGQMLIYSNILNSAQLPTVDALQQSSGWSWSNVLVGNFTLMRWSTYFYCRCVQRALLSNCMQWAN